MKEAKFPGNIKTFQSNNASALVDSRNCEMKDKEEMAKEEGPTVHRFAEAGRGRRRGKWGSYR